MRRPLLSTLIALLVSGGLLYWLLRGTSLETIQDALERIPPWRVGLGVLLLAAVQWVRGWRFAVLIHGSLHAPSAELVRVTLHLLLFNFVLPFKLGEASFPVLMRRAFGTDLGSAVGHLLVVRAFDVMTVLGLMLLAAASLPTGLLPEPSAPLLMVLGLIALATPAALVVLFGHLRGMAPSSARIMRRLTEGAANAGSPRLLLALLAQSVVIWGTHILVAWLVIHPVAPEIPWPAIAMANSAVHLAFALPVPAVAGLGAPQAAWVAALTLTGVSWSLATATALLLHGVILLAV
ncbi:MAG: lysylphosphatidylglycerol synthase transmembrane domain-containing protein, partial [Geminicoccaceae bacterium]|nr:lysylphosphatidylglycerol synthase transmembrane domain-containing protein [Geminicoccaceae bacterium]